MAVASAGGSGSNGNLTEGTNPPSTGATANGKVSADIDGTNDRLGNTNSLDVFFGALGTAYSIAGVIASDASSASTAGSPYADAAIYTNDNQGTAYCTFTDDGIGFGHYDGVSFKIIYQACPDDGAPHTFHGWYDGTNLNLTVDGSTATPVAAGAATFLIGYDALQLGRNYDDGASFNGRVWDLMFSATNLGSTARTDIESYFQDTYFSDPGLITSATTAVAFSQTGTLTATGSLVGTAAAAFSQTGTIHSAGEPTVILHSTVSTKTRLDSNVSTKTRLRSTVPKIDRP